MRTDPVPRSRLLVLIAEFPSTGVIVATRPAGGMKLQRFLIELLTRDGAGVTRVAMAPLGDRPVARPGAGLPPAVYAKDPSTGRRQTRGQRPTSMTHQSKE